MFVHTGTIIDSVLCMVVRHEIKLGYNQVKQHSRILSRTFRKLVPGMHIDM